MAFETFFGPADQVARHHIIGFWAGLTFAGQTGTFTTVFSVVVVLFETSVVEIYSRQKSDNVGDDMEVTDVLVVHQVKIQERPVFMVIGGFLDKFISQRGCNRGDSNVENFFKSWQVVETTTRGKISGSKSKFDYLGNF